MAKTVTVIHNYPEKLVDCNDFVALGICLEHRIAESLMTCILSSHVVDSIDAFFVLTLDAVLRDFSLKPCLFSCNQLAGKNRIDACREETSHIGIT